MYKQWKKWVVDRKHDPLKIKNLPHLIKFCDVVDAASQKYGIPCVMYEAYPVAGHETTLTYQAGSPNFNLFRLLPGGWYIYRNPFLHLWKECDVDEGIEDVFAGMSNDRYHQPHGAVELPADYNLYFMQIESQLLRDDQACRSALSHARETKTYTVFKSHPATDIPSKVTWERYTNEGLISEYSIFVENMSTDDLTRNANFVYSSDSAASFNAFLQGKRVATFHQTDLSEIVPIIETPYELDNIQPASSEQRKQFLSWYYHNLSIDIFKDGFDEKIHDIVQMASVGKTAEEILRCM